MGSRLPQYENKLESKVARAGAMSLTEDAIEFADLAGVVGIPFEGVVLRQRPGLDKVAQLFVDLLVRQLRGRRAERRRTWIQSKTCPRAEECGGDFRLSWCDARRDKDGQCRREQNLHSATPA